MAKRARKKPDEKLAPKLAQQGLNIFKQTLVFIGRPAFFILSNILAATLFIFYITGHYSRTVSKKLLSQLSRFSGQIIKNYRRNLKIMRKAFGRRRPKLTVFRKKRIRFQPKFELPRFKWPKISFKFAWPQLKRLSYAKPHLPKITLPQIIIPSIRTAWLKLPKKLSLVVILFVIFLILPLSFIFKVFQNLPSPQTLKSRSLEVSTKIYDRNGFLLYKIFQNKNRTILPLEEIPLHVRLATLAAEDAEFYNHPGFSLKGITRAIYKNLTRGDLTGGSTITQQLVKNALLNPEKTWLRKAKEIVLALQVEMAYTKDEILEMYLNEVSYGGTAYGIAEASQLYFGKTVDRLTLAEAALLAGLPKSPTKYSPFGANLNLAVARHEEVLHLMKVNGYITADQENEAQKQQLTFADSKTDIKAPHFVMYVRQYLEETYGRELVEKGGLNVTTSLDYEIQKLAETVVTKEIEKLRSLNVTNAAVVILNPRTGEILAMVGSQNYFDQENGGNVNVTTAARQPGSSIKIVNYAYALSHGYTPATFIPDTPVTFLVEGQPPYTPKNYDGNYRGNITLRSAFAESRNIPAVRVLASYGVKNMIEMGKTLGITTWDEENRFGLSLTLGGGEIKLIDLARVYATVANYGKRPEVAAILNIADYQGKNVYHNSCTEFETDKQKSKFGSQISALEVSTPDCEQKAVLDPRVAYLITDILKDNGARSPAFGSLSQLVIPNHPEVAVKTGTSNNLRDNLTIGYNQKYLVAVWVGNNDNSQMSRVASGVTGASPIFNKIMSALLADQSNHDWEIPEGLVRAPICLKNGEGQTISKTEWFLKENIFKADCKKTIEDLGKDLPKTNPNL